MCSGKIYYDLLAHREDVGRDDVAIVRIEQFYPLPDEHLSSVLGVYPEGTPVFWVQDEPDNMGAWRHLRARFGDNVFGRHAFSGVCRVESASPATGSASSHRLEQKDLLDRALAGL
jgi:2-oxoglutarate dehydrogenase E1 component